MAWVRPTAVALLFLIGLCASQVSAASYDGPLATAIMCETGAVLFAVYPIRPVPKWARPLQVVVVLVGLAVIVDSFGRFYAE